MGQPPSKTIFLTDCTLLSGGTAVKQSHRLHRLQFTSGGTATKTKKNHLLHTLQITTEGTAIERIRLLPKLQITFEGTSHHAELAAAASYKYFRPLEGLLNDLLRLNISQKNVLVKQDPSLQNTFFDGLPIAQPTTFSDARRGPRGQRGWRNCEVAAKIRRKQQTSSG